MLPERKKVNETAAQQIGSRRIKRQQIVWFDNGKGFSVDVGKNE